MSPRHDLGARVRDESESGLRARGSEDSWTAGGNHHKGVRRGVALCRVFSRPDLSYAEGAALAREIESWSSRVARRVDVRGFILDLRAAPPISGPKTIEAKRQMLGRFLARDLRVVVVHAGESATQTMQLRRLLGSLVSTPKVKPTPDAGSAAQGDELARLTTSVRMACGWVGLDANHLPLEMRDAPRSEAP